MAGGLGMVELVRTLTWGQIIPLILSLAFAGVDLHSRRIPNVLTFGGALGGMIYNVALGGWSGLAQGGLGLLLGLGLLMLPYIMGGAGAGDVKALAALGAWLGPMPLISLFFYMAVAGGIMSLGALLWRGMLGSFLRRVWNALVSVVMTREPRDLMGAVPEGKGSGIPYGVAIAAGMVALIWWGEIF